MNITKEQELEVIDLFLNSNMSLTSIAEKYGRTSRDFVYRILDSHGISRKRRHIANKITKNDIDNVIYLYQKQNMPMSKIAERYKTSSNAVKKILVQNNINIRRHYKQSFNENYFDNIDTNNKAYLLGFLYADGCIQKNNVVSIVVHEKDREILEMYAKELDATNIINKVSNKQHVRISFCSKHMCDTLIELGCGHNKTNELKFPDINGKYKYDFIRGFMDGDGCICITNRREYKYISLSFTGTLEMMQSLKDIFNVDNNIKFYRNAYCIHIGKTEDVLRILKNIYSNATLYMSRKYNKYKEFIEWYRERQ